MKHNENILFSLQPIWDYDYEFDNHLAKRDGLFRPGKGIRTESC